MACDMTAIVLTKDEEKNIANCLESIKNLVSRIVVVDSGSTDRTIDIVKKYGADIYTHEWIHYTNQFSWALDNVNVETQWVFRIDADEVVPADLAEEIQQECNKHSDDEVNGFDMPFKISFLGRELRHGGTYPVWKVTILNSIAEGLRTGRWGSTLYYRMENQLSSKMIAYITILRISALGFLSTTTIRPGK